MKKDDLHSFIKLCHDAKSIDKMEDLFNLFLTLEEKEMLRARYQILQALLKGDLTQREIAEKYQVSIAQITRGSNALKIIDKKLKIFLEKHFLHS